MNKILFTGARSGIAASVIKQLLKDYYIYVTVHTDEQLTCIKEKYKNYNNVKCFKLDITNNKDRKKIEKLDIDILVNNAAIGYGGSICEIDMNKVRDNFEVNVFSSFEIVQIVIKNMIKKRKGKIIIMSSLAGLVPMNFLGVYSATKSSIIKLTTTLKNELKQLNSDIKICLIEPGMYYTGFNQVMINNKYEWMEKSSYFKEELDIIMKKENIFFSMFEKRNLNSITNKIVKAIKKEDPKFIYRSPIEQVLFSKFYELFFQ